MAFLNAPTAARVANSAAKSAAQVTRGLSMASRAKEKKSRRFFPAAVFSGRDGRPTFLRNTRLDRTEAPRDGQTSRQMLRRRGSGGVADDTLVGHGGGGARRRKLSVSLLAHPAESLSLIHI